MILSQVVVVPQKSVALITSMGVNYFNSKALKVVFRSEECWWSLISAILKMVSTSSKLLALPHSL